MGSSASVADWTDHVKALGEGLLMNEIDLWMTGVNRNVEGKQIRKIMRYSGGHPAFRAHCDAVAADGYRKPALAWPDHTVSARTAASRRKPTLRWPPRGVQARAFPDPHSPRLAAAITAKTLETRSVLERGR